MEVIQRSPWASPNIIFTLRTFVLGPEDTQHALGREHGNAKINGRKLKHALGEFMEHQIIELRDYPIF